MDIWELPAAWHLSNRKITLISSSRNHKLSNLLSPSAYLSQKLRSIIKVLQFRYTRPIGTGNILWSVICDCNVVFLIPFLHPFFILLNNFHSFWYFFTFLFYYHVTCTYRILRYIYLYILHLYFYIIYLCGNVIQSTDCKVYFNYWSNSLTA